MAELYPLSPLYAAVMVFPPLASPAALPLIVRVAVAVADVALYRPIRRDGNR